MVLAPLSSTWGQAPFKKKNNWTVLAYDAHSQVQGFSGRSALHTTSLSVSLRSNMIYTSAKRGWCKVSGKLFNSEEARVCWSPLPPVLCNHSLLLLNVSDRSYSIACWAKSRQTILEVISQFSFHMFNWGSSKLYQMLAISHMQAAEVKKQPV